MEETKLDLTKILTEEDAETTLYSPAYGEIKYRYTAPNKEIVAKDKRDYYRRFMSDGTLTEGMGECMLFPSKEIRDWSLFKVPYVVLTGNKFQDNILIETLCPNENIKKSVEYVEDAIVFIERLEGIVKELFPDDDTVKEIRDYILKTGIIIRPEIKFEPFDKVLVRDEDEESWDIDFFKSYDKDQQYPYRCMIMNGYKQCILYTEKTKHLFGTNKSI